MIVCVSLVRACGPCFIWPVPWPFRFFCFVFAFLLSFLDPVTSLFFGLFLFSFNIFTREPQPATSALSFSRTGGERRAEASPPVLHFEEKKSAARTEGAQSLQVPSRIVRRPSPDPAARSQALAAGAIGSALCAPAISANPWIFWYDCERSRSLVLYTR